MRKANLVEFSELLEHAETLGYDWNDTCDLLDEFRPSEGASFYSLKLSQLNKKKNTAGFDSLRDIEYPDRINEILTSFFVKHNVVDIDIYWD